MKNINKSQKYGTKIKNMVQNFYYTITAEKTCIEKIYNCTKCNICELWDAPIQLSRRAYRYL